MDDGALSHWSRVNGCDFVHLFNGSISLPPSITSAVNELQASRCNNKDWRSPLLATILPPCAASVSFLCSLALAQGAGKLARVSCAIPVVAPIVGGIGVAVASAISAQVSFTVRRLCESNGRFENLELISREKALFYALFGVVAYKVLGGSLRNVMPSNVIRPGAHAHSSIPSRGIRYANDVESGLIKDLFKRFGCHHCGRRRGLPLQNTCLRICSRRRPWLETSSRGCCEYNPRCHNACIRNACRARSSRVRHCDTGNTSWCFITTEAFRSHQPGRGFALEHCRFRKTTSPNSPIHSELDGRIVLSESLNCSTFSGFQDGEVASLPSLVKSVF